jgi:Fe-Mn family superoxide dismutase
MTSRRTFLTFLAAGAAGLAAPSLVRAQAARFVQPPLGYDGAALSPVIGERTVELHYGRHHAGYYTALNRLVQGRMYESMSLIDIVKRSTLIVEDQPILNQAGQAYNHELYWEQFKPGGANAPTGALLAKIDSDLGGLAKMKTDLQAASVGVFGSGWGWLVQNPDGKLAIVTTPGGNNPIGRNQTPLIGIDVWEHAYYLDYENRRADHVKAVLDYLVNWDVVASRMKA